MKTENQISLRGPSAPYNGQLERGPDESYSGQAIRLDLAGYGGALHLGWEGDFMAERPDDYAALIIRACNSHAQLVAALTDIETTARNTANTFPNMPGRVDLLRIAMNARAALAAAQS